MGKAEPTDAGWKTGRQDCPRGATPRAPAQRGSVNPKGPHGALRPGVPSGGPVGGGLAQTPWGCCHVGTRGQVRQTLQDDRTGPGSQETLSFRALAFMRPPARQSPRAHHRLRAFCHLPAPPRTFPPTRPPRWSSHVPPGLCAAVACAREAVPSWPLGSLPFRASAHWSLYQKGWT